MGNSCYTLPGRELPVAAEADVLVAGGGPAGVAAALAAARNGARVLILEQRGFLGGMGTLALVPAFCPYTDKEKPVIRGIGLEMLDRMKAASPASFREQYGDMLDWVPIDAEVLKLVYDDAVLEAGVQVLFHSFVADVALAVGGSSLEGVIVANKAGLSMVKAKYFIDATGDGDLAARAGAPIQKGGENGELQPGTMCYVLARADRKRFRQYLKDSGDGGQIPLAVEKAQLKGDLPEGRKKVSGFAWLADDLVSVNFGHVFGVDGTRPEDLTRGAMEGRKLVQVQVEFLRRYVPGFEHVHVVATGEQLGIRETRRIEGDYVLSTEDFMKLRSFPDDIARNAYFIDVHLAHSKGETRIHRLAPGESHGVPYRCILPKGLDNLWVPGRAASSDRTVQGSLRVMPNCFAMGQAAGTAAALALEQGGVTSREVEVERLQRILVAQGAWLGEHFAPAVKEST